jgi:hypothetical protein
MGESPSYHKGLVMKKLFFLLITIFTLYILIMAVMDNLYLIRDAKGQIENHYIELTNLLERNRNRRGRRHDPAKHRLAG